MKQISIGIQVGFEIPAQAPGFVGTLAALSTMTTSGHLWQPDDRSDCAAYIDLSNVASVTTTGGNITNIANLSTAAGSAGSSLDLSDGGVSGRRPAYTSGVSADFNGTSNILGSGAFSLAQPCTVVVGFKLLSGVASNAGIVDARTSGQRMIFCQNATNHVLAAYMGGAAVLSQANGSYADDTATAAGAAFSTTTTSGDGTIFRALGQTNVGPGTQVGAAAASGWVIGARGGTNGAGANFCKCSIYKAAIFTSALSAADLAIAVAWANIHN